MVLKAAVQMLREADELKQKILRFKTGTSMLQDRNLWAIQQQLQKVYQKILILDLDYALEKKVEQDLWNVGFKQQIEALQAISKDKKSPLRSDGQAMLSWVLQAAAGFYLCLLHQICTTFKLDLPFRRRASLLGAVEAWEPGPGGAPPPGPVSGGAAAARYASQHCLVHLGDLARYRQQLRLAQTFYRHALAVSPHSGQPYNQLALVWWRRGRRLCAVYAHVRSLLVRAPFPPAPANLARTLRAAAVPAASSARANDKDMPLPVLPGIVGCGGGGGGGGGGRDAGEGAGERIDEHEYCDELLRALHFIHSIEQLDIAASLVESLNWSLTPLIATDSFDSMTLIKISCILIWAVLSSSEEQPAQALSAEEAGAARLADSLAAACVLALLLPAYTSDGPPAAAQPALKVWLQWLAHQPALCGSAAWRARPQLWAALAHAITALADDAHALADDTYDTVPLPEDEELHGFLPLEEGYKGLKFASHAGWDANAVPDVDSADDDSGAGAAMGAREPLVQRRVRARRLQQLACRLADCHPDYLTYTTDEDGKVTFEASALGGEELSQALAELSVATGSEGGAPAVGGSAAAPVSPSGPPPPPVIISEADFREKVREKRAGILKPQGSLERAREERNAMHGSQPPEAEASDDSGKSEERREARRPRVNIAMAAIMRKQEESNKQVKFVTPPPTPDAALVAAADTTAKEVEKPKVIQPKPVKSLTNLPVGRKTGGILSLKDKSGYPHLVNVEPEPKKPEKEEKGDGKSNQGAPPYQKRQDAPQGNWAPGGPAQGFDASRMTFPKSYGAAPGGYNPGYPAAAGSPTGQGIKLPVVNPKEIDVRTAALQKQNSRQELYQEPHKFANQGYQMSGDKINFLNDLPPRFANQYRYWHAPDPQPPDNKFRDEAFAPSGYAAPAPPPRAGWAGSPADALQQPAPWWKPDNPPLYNASYNLPLNVPSFYPAGPASASGPYRGAPYAPAATAGAAAPGKPDAGAGYPQAAGQPQLQALQGLVTSPSFNASIGTFSYSPAAYDPAMYPQFGAKLGYPPLQMKLLDEPAYPADAGVDAGLNFGAGLLGAQQRQPGYGDAFKPDASAAGAAPGAGAAAKSSAGESPVHAYSLFSAPGACWPRAAPPHSLWAGSQSPLERLLEQQKQMKPQ